MELAKQQDFQLGIRSHALSTGVVPLCTLDLGVRVCASGQIAETRLFEYPMPTPFVGN